MMHFGLHLQHVAWGRNLELWWRSIAHHRVEESVLAGLAMALVGAFLYFRHLRRPSPEEIERRRCLRLLEVGRLVDGTIIETVETGETGERVGSVVMFTYRVAGVQYTSAQDLNHIPNSAGNFRVDLPVQVRYDPRNPFNSIVAAETWSGLRQS